MNAIDRFLWRVARRIILRFVRRGLANVEETIVSHVDRDREHTITISMRPFTETMTIRFD